MDLHWKISPESVLCSLNHQHIAFCYPDSAVSLICICSLKLLTHLMTVSVVTNIFDQYVANLSAALAHLMSNILDIFQTSCHQH